MSIAGVELMETLKAAAVSYEVDGNRLLDQVSISLSRGELFGVIGPNGAGKTTLLRLLSGILKPRSGSITVSERAISDMTSKEIAQNIAIVPQTSGFTYGFTCQEVVMMGRYPFLGRFQVERESDRKIVRDAMDKTDTWQFVDRLVSTLSGGERQRVFLARALAQQPKVMLLDEPTANLDISHQLRLFEIIRSLRESGLSTIAAIHDISLAARFCSRIAIMAKGRILVDGAPEEVLTSENISQAFGVNAKIYRDPVVGSLTVGVIG